MAGRIAETTGYSGTPLARKLGLRDGLRAYIGNAPASYPQLIGPAFDALQTFAEFSTDVQLAHVFHDQADALTESLRWLRRAMDPACVIWVSWPKKAARVPTDITEDRIREIALPMGLVDIKVCAVDATWSGLKLVLRRELR